MSEIVGLCSQDVQVKVDEVSKKLDIPLPECSEISITESGSTNIIQSQQK